MRLSNFLLDKIVVILVAGALIKTEMYHEITEISPVRCKVIAGPIVCKLCHFGSLVNYVSSLVWGCCLLRHWYGFNITFLSSQGNELRKILLTRYFGNQKLHSKSELGSGNSSSGGFVKPSSAGWYHSDYLAHRKQPQITWQWLCSSGRKEAVQLCASIAFPQTEGVISRVSLHLCRKFPHVGLWQASEHHGGDPVPPRQRRDVGAGDRPHRQHQEWPGVWGEHPAGHRPPPGWKHSDTGEQQLLHGVGEFGGMRLVCLALTDLLPPLPQISFHYQLYKQKKSERFFKVFYDRMRLAQQEIRATVSVNMFELSSRKRDDDGEISSVRYKKGAQKTLEPEELRAAALCWRFADGEQVLGPSTRPSSLRNGAWIKFRAAAL